MGVDKLARAFTNVNKVWEKISPLLLGTKLLRQFRLERYKKNYEELTLKCGDFSMPYDKMTIYIGEMKEDMIEFINNNYNNVLKFNKGNI